MKKYFIQLIPFFVGLLVSGIFATGIITAKFYLVEKSLQTFGAAPIFQPYQGGTGSSTLSGILKGNGINAVQTAISGTDYESPLTFSYPLSRSVNAVSIVATSSMAINTDNLVQGSTNLFNQTHTGDVTGATGLTIASDAVHDSMIDWGTGAGQVSTADITEQTNLFYTDARADARINATSSIDTLLQLLHLANATTTQLTATDAWITKLRNLTSNGFVKTSSSDGTLSIDTNTYLTGNQTITLSGELSGSGATSISGTVADNVIDEANLKITTTPTNNYLLIASSSAPGGMDWVATSSPLLNFGGGGGSGTVTSVGLATPIGLSVSGTNPITGAGTFTLAFNIKETFIPFGGSSGVIATSTAFYFTSGTGTLNATTFVGALTGTASGNLVSANINTIAKLNSYLSGETIASTTAVMTASSDSTWTLHNSYPAACAANTWATTIGDTLTCGAITYAGITAMTSANFAGLISDETGTAGKVVFDTNPTLAGLTATGVIDMGGATSFELPNGASPTVDTDGECAIDTTSGQFKCDLGATVSVIGNGFQYPAFSFPSGTQTATTTIATSTIALGVAFIPETFDSINCFSGTGTVGYQINDGTNLMDFRQATTTPSQFVLSTNNTFTAGEKRFINIGPMTNSYLSCTIKKYITAD